eukprot:3637559-Rhodomonas_salina.1
MAILAYNLYAVYSTDLAYGATRRRATSSVLPRSADLSAYAMSDTHIVYGVVCLRNSYAMSGTHIAYAGRAAGRRKAAGSILYYGPTHSLGALFGTAKAYGPTASSTD